MSRLFKLLSLAAVLWGSAVFAFSPEMPSSVPDTDINTIGDFYIAVCAATKWVLVFGLIIGALFIIWGGVKYITSGGDASSEEKAKKTILTAMIGIVFLILAVAIIRIIASFFGAQNFNFNLSSATCGGTVSSQNGGNPSPTAPPPPPPPPPPGSTAPTPTPSGTPGILPTSPPAPTPTPSGGPPPPPPPPPGP